MKSKFLLAILLSNLFSLIAVAQIVNIPDANFKAALVGDPAINTNGDGEIQVSEASAYTGTIYVFNMGIADMTGLEAFTSLTNLTCAANGISSLNLSANTALTFLDCYLNPITNLDVSANTALTFLNCSNLQLTSLDVSANIALTELRCNFTSLSSLDLSSNTSLERLECRFCGSLTALDVSANTALTYLTCADCSVNSNLNVTGCSVLSHLDCSANSIGSLDLSTNTALTYLDCYYNVITYLDLSNNTALTYLQCSNNQLTGLDLSANLALLHLECPHNQITGLNLSANNSLTYFSCSYNQLSSLNIKNGNNMQLTSFGAMFNPNLSCIQVDSVSFANVASGWFKDSSAVYSENCTSGIEPISGMKPFFFIYPNPSDQELTISFYGDCSACEKTLIIYDNLGNNIYSTSFLDKLKIINDKQFMQGIYFVKVSAEDLQWVEKLIIQ